MVLLSSSPSDTLALPSPSTVNASGVNPSTEAPTTNIYAQYYPQNWPVMPFHEGEVALQRQAGVHHRVMSYAPKVIRPYLPEQHRAFYEAQPFLVAAARDAVGNMWATLLTQPHQQPSTTTSSSSSWIASPDPKTLMWQAQPIADDALEGALRPGSDVGLLGIEFATKRRNRVNGRIVSNGDSNDGKTVFVVDQSFGNCPQYIKPRQWWTTAPSQSPHDNSGTQSTLTSSSTRPTQLSKEQMEFIAQAETIFTATGYRGKGSDVRFGNDASHRGGPAGFLRVVNARSLLLPEFAGNNHFNSLGNLVLDGRMGITIPDFAEGGMLQLSGHASVDMDTERARQTYPGALRLVTFHIEQVNQVAAGSLPVRWRPVREAEQRQLVVSSIVQESDNVKSFHLQPLPDQMQSLWKFNAGQHLPLQLRTPRGELLRTYSLSGAPDGPHEYRISVKHEPLGQASTFLHHQVKVGDILDVSQPAGDFVLDRSSDRTLVLLSSGIGVTPLLSMLHEFASDSAVCATEAVWIHGARNSHQHPFEGEIRGIEENLPKNKTLTTHVRYSQPLPTDTMVPRGRIDLPLIERLVPDLQNADFYICGSGSFMADVELALQKAGVDPSRIRSESF